MNNIIFRSPGQSGFLPARSWMGWALRWTRPENSFRKCQPLPSTGL